MFSITYRLGDFEVVLSADTIDDVLALDDAYGEEDDNDWIDWVWSEEKPYPETLDTQVNVRCGGYENNTPFTVEWWKDGEGVDSWRESIVAYRVVK